MIEFHLVNLVSVIRFCTSFQFSQSMNTQTYNLFKDKCIRTKLRLAYLQYPLVDIYSTSNTTDNSSSKALLLALSWIITKYDILTNVVRLKLLTSSLGREFSKVDSDLVSNECYLVK